MKEELTVNEIAPRALEDSFELSIIKVSGSEDVNLSVVGKSIDLIKALIMAMEEREDFRRVVLETAKGYIGFQKFKESVESKELENK
jgi:hypothetical protein